MVRYVTAVFFLVFALVNPVASLVVVSAPIRPLDKDEIAAVEKLIYHQFPGAKIDLRFAFLFEREESEPYAHMEFESATERVNDRFCQYIYGEAVGELSVGGKVSWRKLEDRFFSRMYFEQNDGLLCGVVDVESAFSVGEEIDISDVDWIVSHQKDVWNDYLISAMNRYGHQYDLLNVKAKLSGISRSGGGRLEVSFRGDGSLGFHATLERVAGRWLVTESLISMP